jgi:hypothetical protein
MTSINSAELFCAAAGNGHVAAQRKQTQQSTTRISLFPQSRKKATFGGKLNVFLLSRRVLFIDRQRCGFVTASQQ